MGNEQSEVDGLRLLYIQLRSNEKGCMLTSDNFFILASVISLESIP